MSEPLTEVESWTDRPALGRSESDWPYPDQHVRSVANGELAARIRQALGVEDEEATVWVEETTVSGGWSEYTQENEYSVKVACDGMGEGFGIGWEGVLPALLKWLDEKAPI